MTVHRDVDDLARRGFLRRERGGVSALPTSMFESSSEFRLERNTDAKAALAHAALAFIEPGMSVMLDDSTTVFELAKALVGTSPLTVLTNYRPGLEVLRESADITLVALGGVYSRTHDSFIGSGDQTGLESYAVDIVFQSTSTMDDTMTYHQERDIVLMKRAMLASGSRRVLLMDQSKIGKTSLNVYVPIERFTDVVLSGEVPDQTIQSMRDRTNVHLLGPTPN